MIVPLISESAWMERLRGLPEWTPPLLPTLVVSPHPDDETLGAGGVIAWLRQQQVDVTVAAVTDGEHAYTDGLDIRARRAQEQTDALARLGVHNDAIHRFAMPDSGLGAVEAQLTDRLSALLKEGMHVLAPWPKDFHPDHEASGRAAKAAARANGAQLTYYLFWTWHRGTLATLDGEGLVAFPLTGELQRARQEALLFHRSQLQHASGEPILPANLLGPMQRAFEVYLPA